MNQDAGPPPEDVLPPAYVFQAYYEVSPELGEEYRAYMKSLRDDLKHRQRTQRIKTIASPLVSIAFMLMVIYLTNLITRIVEHLAAGWASLLTVAPSTLVLVVIWWVARRLERRNQQHT